MPRKQTWKPIPYQSVRNAVRSLRVEGWLTDGEALCLYTLAEKATAPIVEIGTYCGRSACFLAAPGKQPVLTIDPHDAKHRNPAQAAMLGDRDTYELATEYLTGLGAVDRVTLARGTVATVDLPDKVGLAFVDGDHRAAGVQADCDALLDRIVPGGWICFHDWRMTGDEDEPWAVCETVKAAMSGHTATWVLLDLIDGLAVWQREA